MSKLDIFCESTIRAVLTAERELTEEDLSLVGFPVIWAGLLWRLQWASLAVAGILLDILRLATLLFITTSCLSWCSLPSAAW